MRATETCRVCGSRKLTPFFDLGDQPLANALANAPAREAAALDPAYPLSLSFCADCSLVQLDHTADPGELFSHYVWVTSTSSTARAYAEDFCQRLLDRLAPDAAGHVLEVASNDGTFLKPFLKRGVACLGVDPAANIVDMAKAEGVPTCCGFFGTALAGEVLAERGAARAVFARNVLPHVADTNDFVAGLRAAVAKDGLVVIEFHYARTILEELHYDSIYHEHLCYFTLKSLTRLLRAHGLNPFDLEESPISGGSLVLFASPQPRDKSAKLQAFETSEQASGVNDLAAWQGFAETSRQHRQALLALLEAEAKAGRKVAGYGASARSSTMLNFCNVGPRLISAIADQNPMKHGLFSPGTHIPILAPEQVLTPGPAGSGPDTVVILAWNFFAEIAGILRQRFGFAGRLIVPLPHPPRALNMEEVDNG